MTEPLRSGDISLMSKADLRLRVKELMESEGKLIEVCGRLRVWEEHGRLLRAGIESFAGGIYPTHTEILRGQCRLLMQAFDEGVRDAQ